MLDLVSACAKLDRALLHLSELGDHGAAVGEVHRAYLTVADEDLYPDPQGIRHEFRVGLLVRPRSEMASVLGDYIQNLRAALDHLAWEMVLKGTTPEVTDTSAASGIQFPIYNVGRSRPRRQDTFWGTLTKKGQRTGGVWRNLPGVSGSQRAFIAAHQPYHRGQWHLAALAKLSNDDKHRVVRPIHVLGYQFTRRSFRASVGPVHRWRAFVIAGDPVDEGARFLEVVVNPNAQVIMKGDLHSEIAFEERPGRYHRIPALRELGQSVAQIVETAARRWGNAQDAERCQTWSKQAQVALYTGLPPSPERIEALAQAIVRDLGPRLINRATMLPATFFPVPPFQDLPGRLAMSIRRNM